MTTLQEAIEKFGISQMKITQDELRAVLNYSPETGVFTWKISLHNGIYAGDVAGSMKGPHRHVRIQFNKNFYQAHRLAWLYMHGSVPACEIDHINGEGSDNRLSNLRLASTAQNQWNSAMRKDNTSGIKGVTYNSSTKRWIAACKAGGKAKHIGSFVNKEDAALAIANFRSTHHGEFARLK